MQRLFTKIADGSSPNGRWFAGDINAIQDAVAALTDFTQTISLGIAAIGESGLQLLRYGAGEARLTGALRTDGIIRALGGLYAGAFTTTQRNAIGAGLAPYGLVILNTTTNQYEWNKGTDGARDWQPFGGATGGVGTLALRPAANSVPAGTRYFATDQVVDYISDGANWIRMSVPAGITVNWFGAAAPAGWVIYDGSNLPSAVGIYADLNAHLGGTLTPNTKGRVIVGLDGAQAEFDTLKETGGAKTHTLVIGEIPAHNHGGGNHGHTFNSTVPNLYGAGSTQDSAATDGGDDIHVNGTSASINASGTIISTEGGGGAHNNLQPYIVAHKIAKL